MKYLIRKNESSYLFILKEVSRSPVAVPILVKQQRNPSENRIIAESQKYISKWRTEGVKPEELKKLDEWIDQYLTDYYKTTYSL